MESNYAQMRTIDKFSTDILMAGFTIFEQRCDAKKYCCKTKYHMNKLIDPLVKWSRSIPYLEEKGYEIKIDINQIEDKEFQTSFFEYKVTIFKQLN